MLIDLLFEIEIIYDLLVSVLLTNCIGAYDIVPCLQCSFLSISIVVSGSAIPLGSTDRNTDSIRSRSRLITEIVVDGPAIVCSVVELEAADAFGIGP